MTAPFLVPGWAPCVFLAGVCGLMACWPRYTRRRRTGKDRGEANFATVLVALILAIAACSIANTIWGHR